MRSFSEWYIILFKQESFAYWTNVVWRKTAKIKFILYFSSPALLFVKVSHRFVTTFVIYRRMKVHGGEFCYKKVINASYKRKPRKIKFFKTLQHYRFEAPLWVLETGGNFLYIWINEDISPYFELLSVVNKNFVYISKFIYSPY